jgi:hypothetical protein
VIFASVGTNRSKNHSSTERAAIFCCCCCCYCVVVVLLCSRVGRRDSRRVSSRRLSWCGSMICELRQRFSSKISNFGIFPSTLRFPPSSLVLSIFYLHPPLAPPFTPTTHQRWPYLSPIAVTRSPRILK